MSSAVCLQLCCILLAVVVVSASPVAGPRGRRCGGLGHRTSRSTASDVQYAVVIDAGSSGSRVRVYKWPDNGRSGALMAGVESIKSTLKKEPGLADVADNETNVRNHIEQLIRNASGSIPPSHHDDTPIYFMATAGRCQNARYFYPTSLQYSEGNPHDGDVECRWGMKKIDIFNQYLASSRVVTGVTVSLVLST